MGLLRSTRPGEREACVLLILVMPDLTSPFANAGFIVYRPFDAEVQEHGRRSVFYRPAVAPWKSNFGRLRHTLSP